MDLTYLQDNTVKFCHISKPGIFYKTSSSVGSLEMDGGGTYGFAVDGDVTSMLKVGNNNQSINININANTSTTIYNTEGLYNPVYILKLNCTNTDIVSNPTCTATLTVNGTAYTKTWYATPVNFLTWTNKLCGKTNLQMIFNSNCNVTGTLQIISDTIVDQTL